MRARRSGERGVALIYAALLLLVVAVLGAIGLERALRVRDDVVVDHASLAALHAADGGLEYARAALARDAAWTGDTLEVGAAAVEVTVTRAGPGWTVHVRATARAAPAIDKVVRNVEAALVPTDALPRVVGYRDR